ncbi:MAG: Glucokinase [Nitrospira sp.]|jgi:glucokinase|nr:MAG: Glucokinase [Nitrospira sp.]
MILAGDIGGTKTNLALYDWTTERVEPVREDSFHSADYKTLEEIVEEFLSAPPPKPSIDDDPVDGADVEAGAEAEKKAEPPSEPLKLTAACFGVAGPVIDNRCRTTNLPWVIEGAALAQRFDIPQVQLLNDLEATAHGILLLRPDELVVLNAGAPPKKKQALALIAAGTGLGECILYWDGTRYRPMPSEGGHTDFAPNSDSEIELLRHLRGSYLHVSYERIVSGPGLHAIYEYLRDTKKNEPTWLAEKIKVGNPAAEIAEAGLKGQAEIAKQALDLFASIYGAEAGNLALKALTLDGVYVAGGIAPKLLKKLQDGSFMRGFTNKGRYKRMMGQIPVKVVTNDKTALLGAASVAAQLTHALSS